MSINEERVGDTDSLCLCVIQTHKQLLDQPIDLEEEMKNSQSQRRLGVILLCVFSFLI